MNRSRITLLSTAALAAGLLAAPTPVAAADPASTAGPAKAAMKPSEPPPRTDPAAVDELAEKLAHQNLGAAAPVLRAPPPNDACANAVPIACGSLTTVDIGMATQAPTDPVFPCRITASAAGFNTVWYTFVATATAARVTTCGSTSDTMLGVYSGSCGAFTQLDCNDDSDACGAGLQSAANASGLTVGQTYYIQLALFGVSTTTANITLHLDCTGTVAANDLCSGAIALTSGTAAAADTTTGGDSPNDPVLSCNNTGHPADGTLWYTFTAAAATALVDTCASTVGDSVVAAYSGTCGALTEIGCNNDSPSCTPRSSLQLAGLTVGQTYYVHVGIKTFTNTRRQALSLRVLTPDPSPPPAANDTCATAIALTIGTPLAAGNIGATNEVPAPPTCTGLVTFNNGVWFTVVGNGRGLETSTCNPGTVLNTRLYVYSGSCGAFTCVGANATATPACGANAGAATVNFCSTAGTTYYVLVTNDVAGTGAFEVSVRDLGVCPPLNDTIGAARAIAAPSSTAGDTRFATTDTGVVTCGASALAGPGVWYRVNGTGRTLTASTCNSTLPAYDTRVNVYCGNAGGPLAGLTCVAGNDNTVGCGSGTQSRATFCSQFGGVYYILVHGGTGGAFLLDVADDGAACTATVACLPQGGCCVGATCSVTTQAGCTQAGGTYRGDNAPCVTLGTSSADFTSSPNLAIPDSPNPGVSDTQTLAATGLVGDVNARVQIPNHTFLGDLTIDLTHGSTTVRLWNRLCGGDDGMDVTFDDEGTAVVCAVGALVPTVGTFLPTAPLAAFDGSAIAGAWTLTITDNAGADTGTLASWTLTINTGTPACGGGNPCPPDWNVDGEVNGNDISDYINSWYLDIVNGTVIADYNHDGETNGNDISDYINSWYGAIINGGTC